eukprot:EG_transcript_6203
MSIPLELLRPEARQKREAEERQRELEEAREQRDESERWLKRAVHNYDVAQRELAEARRETEAAEARHRRAAEDGEALQRALEEMTKEKSDLEAKINRATQDRKENLQTLTELQTKVRRMDEDMRRLEAELRCKNLELRKCRELNASQQLQLREQESRAESLAAEFENKLKAEEGKRAELEAWLKAMERELETATAEATVLRAELRRAAEAAEAAQQRRAAQQAQREAMEQELRTATAEAATLTAQLAERERAAAELQCAGAAAQQRAATQQAQLEAMEQELRTATAEAATLTAQLAERERAAAELQCAGAAAQQRAATQQAQLEASSSVDAVEVVPDCLGSTSQSGSPWPPPRRRLSVTVLQPAEPELSALYGDHLDPPLVTAITAPLRLQPRPSWDFRHAMTLGLVEGPGGGRPRSLLCAATVRVHAPPGHHFLELAAFACAKPDQKLREGLVLMAVVKHYAHLMECSTIFVQAPSDALWPTVMGFVPAVLRDKPLARYCALRCFAPASSVPLQCAVAAELGAFALGRLGEPARLTVSLQVPDREAKDSGPQWGYECATVALEEGSPAKRRRRT